MPSAPPGVDIVRFDTTDQSLRFRDVDLFDAVHRAGGIAWTESAGGMWVVGRFDLIWKIGNDMRFRSGEGVRFPPSGAPKVPALEYDRPVHTAHRKLLSSAVGIRAVRPLEGMVRRHARRLLSRWSESTVADLGRDYAFPMPLDVIFSIVGAPDGIKERVNELTESLFLYRTPMRDGSDPTVGIRELLDGLIADKLANPGEDWLSSVVTGRRVAGVELADSEIRGAILAMLAGGHHSTSRGIACLLAEIVQDPALQQRLRADPASIPAMAEESLRRHTPLRWFARTASEDVEIEGRMIRRHDRVYLLYGAGNLDPLAFDAPRSLSPGGRKNAAHLAFGAGMHRCVGMPLAQLELKVAVEEILAHSDDIVLDGEINWTSLVEPRHIPVRLCGFTRPAVCGDV